MILRDVDNIKVGSTSVNKVYQGNYKVYDKNKIALEGYCKQGLPSEYQQVEYIESTGTQYINTGFPLFNYENHEIIMDFEPTEFFNYNSLFGTSSGPDIIEGWIYVNSALTCRYNYERYSPTFYQTTINTRYLLDIKKEGTTLSEYIDNNLIGTATASTLLVNGVLYLLRSGDDYGKHKLYNCKLYSNGTLVRNFIPCYRKSDSVIGLYDLVNNVFYTNAGTGTFNKGSDVPNPNYPQEIEVMEGKQVVNVKGQDFEVDLKSKNLYEGSQDFSGTWGNNSFWGTDDSTYNNLVVKKRTGSWNGLYKEIEVEEGKTYTFSCYIKSDSARPIAIYSSGGTSGISLYKQFNTTDSWERYSFTITASASGTVRFRIENTTSVAGNYTYICGYQLEEGSATDYEPYYNYKLAGIGDYKDNIYTKEGKWYVKNVINKLIFDGTQEIINLNSNLDNTIRVTFSDMIDGGINSILLYCNQFVRKNMFNLDEEGIYYNITNGNVFFRAYKTTIGTTKTEINNYLVNHNIKLYYPTTNTTEEEITSPTLIQQLNRLYQAM